MKPEQMKGKVTLVEIINRLNENGKKDILLVLEKQVKNGKVEMETLRSAIENIGLNSSEVSDEDLELMLKNIK
ncbi:MAG: hypothetical protein WCX27_01035 [Candidatus Paceibacterota bacterium]|jgi:hypothetical protein